VCTAPLPLSAPRFSYAHKNVNGMITCSMMHFILTYFKHRFLFNRDFIKRFLLFIFRLDSHVNQQPYNASDCGVYSESKPAAQFQFNSI